MKDKIKTLYRLGIVNILTVAVYRILKKAGYYRYKLPIVPLPDESYFSNIKAKRTDKYKVTYFSFHTVEVSSPPNWHLNPWNDAECSNTSIHWSAMSDFVPELGDIKLVWELSRFDWLSKMAWAYNQGDNDSLPLLEFWLSDWVKANPVNAGVNWKCGQETSFRCINLMMASLLIDNNFEKPNRGLLALLESHLDRVSPTLLYAMAQDNNHGTSEAAALFVVGEYLKIHGSREQKSKGKTLARKGRYWLENRVQRLVLDDGSFSQFSTTYHRLFLDTISFAELVRFKLGVDSLSSTFYTKMQQAVKWLHLMTNRFSGDAPNLGANDGAYLLNLNESAYRDFRPSVQLGAAIFLEKSFNYDDSKRHPLLKVFNLKIDALPLLAHDKPSIFTMRKGGFSLLTNSGNFAMMRLPIFQFRPSHADALHLDLWLNGENVLTDDGSYSYNTAPDIAQCFGGTASHNTIQFDDRDQMPRISRFLFGSWLSADCIKTVDNKGEDATVTASYRDYRGARHSRTVTLTRQRLVITDRVSGFKNKAVLRWRLPQGEWVQNGTTISNDLHQLKVTSDVPFIGFNISSCWSSRHYMDKERLQVLEVEINQEAELKTEYLW